MKTQIFHLKGSSEDEIAIQCAAQIIREGGIVVFPTETVYGLGASAFDEEAVLKVFRAKGRPTDNPLIVHIASLDQLYEVVSHLPMEEETFHKLATRLWPGPITFILPRSQKVSAVVSGGLSTVGVRMPAHPVALRLVELSGVPIAAPSANLSGRPSPTDESHVLEDMSGRADVILLAGRTPLGVESTVIDLTTSPPRLLRPGPVDPVRLQELLGMEIEISDAARGLITQERPVSPGMKYRHYAPSKPLILIEGAKEFVLIVMRELIEARPTAVICSVQTARELEYEDHVLVWGKREDLFSAAKNLFELLRRAEKLPVDVIIAEGVDEKGIGLAVMNRLRRAASEVIKETSP